MISTESFTRRASDSRRSLTSETAVFLGPILRLIAILWKNAHLVVLGVIGLYAISGVTFIQANEAGVVLRLGAVTHVDNDPIIHRPGLLFALPKPFDEVLVVDVERISTLVIEDLAHNESFQSKPFAPDEIPTLPEDFSPSQNHNYLLTGDRNLLHTRVVVRYRISGPIQYTLLTDNQTSFLRSAILEGTTSTAGGTRLDDILSGRRDQFSAAVAIDAQARLDRIGTGLEIISVEYENLSPPVQVSADFDAVQSSYIEAETSIRNARAYAARTVPTARAKGSEIGTDSASQANLIVAQARAHQASFASLLTTYWAHPDLVKQRVYRESVQRSLRSVAQLTFIPEPPASGYNGTRISISRSRLEVSKDTEGQKADHPTGERLEENQPGEWNDSQEIQLTSGDGL